QAALTKFKIAADAYPSSDAGIYARYQEAALSLALGSPTGAAAAYQRVIAGNGDGFYGQMARLGLAEAQARAGQYDQAINAFKELAQRKVGATCPGIGDSSTTSHPTTVRRSITRRSSARASYHDNPPGSGVPVAGMMAGSKPSTSIVM